MARQNKYIQNPDAILYQDYTPIGDITERVRQENADRIFTGGVRINSSRYRTKTEDEKYRNDSLCKKLP